MGGESGASAQEDLSEGLDEGGETVQEPNAGDDGHDDEPEPEEDVDLLVEDVEGKNAEAVVTFDVSGRTILTEGAFRNLDTVAMKRDALIETLCFMLGGCACGSVSVQPHANLTPFGWLAVRYNGQQWLAVSCHK